MSENSQMQEIVYTLFKKLITKRPDLHTHDYSNYKEYKAEQNMISNQRTRALNALVKFGTLPLCLETLDYALRISFGGRLVISTKEQGVLHLKYYVGQYYPVEYRQAAAIVLETYSDLSQRARVKSSSIVENLAV